MERRLAARTVLLDDAGKVAILKVAKFDYYKIPGGGVEEGEDTEIAAQREVMEEAGCECVVLSVLGKITTEIPEWDMVDVSMGFVARVIGDKQVPEFDDFEKERGFELVWAGDLAEAIHVFESHQVVEASAKLLQQRDLEFLKRAAGWSAGGGIRSDS